MNSLVSAEIQSSQESNTAMNGFTLSALRRVPELNDMAKRVVDAEKKRKRREEAHSQKSSRSRTQPSATKENRNITMSSSSSFSKESTKPKMKRLFQHALLELVKQGNVVLWSGPYYDFIPQCHLRAENMPWKSLSYPDETMATEKTVGGDSLSIVGDGGDDQMVVTDPEDDYEEEAYISVTTEYLAEEVERTIRRLDQRRRATTKKTILDCLRGDDRWQFLGDWSVEHALEYLSNDGRIREGEKGWVLCR